MKALTCGVLLSAMASTVSAASWLGPDEMNELLHRVTEDEETPNLGFHDAIDVRSIKKDWKDNPARAQIKYGKAHSYLGGLRAIDVRNGSDGDLILEDGSKMGVRAVLFQYQLYPWEKKNGKWTPTGAVTTLDFAAKYDKGQRFFLMCKQAQPDFLFDCLAYPEEVARD
ncbi:TPA: hypothetical protein ACGJWA_001946 [Pseudomonas aeruginosa]|uniref:hypothetical protein n=1 Tax=Pseudomonas aeruginosa TaxID=287 RepID=UPI00053D2B49|nr:hypothetical protein [Pseudomonas aeruginosa]HBO1242686.1 hypothetical protein [Pseudomonas aeruginosa]HBO1878596.1 hypothetical protein [Pseudomonas aeruginosa]HBO2083137.1 hypothetical protein [Pseudomonas aeruginosa]